MEAATLLTSARFLSMPMEYDACGNRLKDELVGGKVIIIPPSSLRDSIVISNLAQILIAYLLANQHLDLRVLVETGFKVNDCDVFVTDVSVLMRKRLDGNARILIGAPEIAIEVVSPIDTAYYIKKKVSAYLDGGSSAVWVVFPGNGSIEVHTPGNIRDIKGDQIINDPLLPGFSIPAHAAFSF